MARAASKQLPPGRDGIDVENLPMVENNGDWEVVTLGKMEDGGETAPAMQKLEVAPPEAEAEEVDRSVIAAGVALYALCSSTLLVINKVAMYNLPNASFVLICQFVASSLAVRGLRLAKPDMDIELICWEKAKPFLVATLVFFMCLYANTKALGSVNVETVIVVRSCSPIAVAALEKMALRKALPSAAGMLSLVGISIGAVLYVIVDKGFRVDGYIWLAVYFVFIVIEMVFVKFVVDTVQMSTWTRVYYNNTLSVPMAATAYFLGDSKPFSLNFAAVASVLLSCVVGVGISYAGFNLRKLVSATSFTVVGVVCKIFTVLINDLIWSQHSNLVGHAGLLLCIACGFVFERVKKRG